MKIFKYFIATALLLSLILTCFAGCQTTTKLEDFDVPDNFDTSKKYEIDFWAKNDTNLTQVEIYKKAVADFEYIS